MKKDKYNKLTSKPSLEVLTFLKSLTSKDILYTYSNSDIVSLLNKKGIHASIRTFDRMIANCRDILANSLNEELIEENEILADDILTAIETIKSEYISMYRKRVVDEVLNTDSNIGAQIADKHLRIMDKELHVNKDIKLNINNNNFLDKMSDEELDNEIEKISKEFDEFDD